MGSEKILVVDDAPETLEFVADYVLKPHGFQVLTARDGAEGLRKALREEPDLIVLDMQMPRMTGVEMLEALHQQGKSIPTILMTAEGSEQLAVQVFRMGVRDYVIKPFQPEEMLQAIERALTEARLRRERDQLMVSLMRANRQLERRVKELNTLYGIGKSVTALLDLEKLLNRLVEAAVYITGAEEGSLLLVDERTNELYMRAAQGFDEKYARSFRLKVDDSIAGNVVRTGEPVVIGGGAHRIKTAYMVKSLINVPIKVKDRVIGVLGVDNRQSDRAFTNNDLYLLSALADYAAIAIENARLFATVEEERSKLAAILKKTEDAVIVTDPHNRVLLLNRTARQAFGVTRDMEVTGRPLEEVIDHQALIDLFARSWRENRLQRGEISLPDGRTLNAHVTPIPGVGRAAVMQDITHLKELDRMKSEFVSTVSHDLRSPLTSIRGFVELLPVAGPLTEKQQEFVERIKSSIIAITELIDDLLDIGKIEAGVNLEMEPCQLEEIIAKSVEHLRGEATAKGQQLILQLPPRLSPVLGNALRLGQAVSNLVGNAIKYTPPGGTITVSAEDIGDQVCVRVQDTGIGIPPADLPHIFEKFYRVHNEATQDIQGTGLGLSIVKSIIEKHNGRVWAESEVGVGSTFTFILPVYQGNSVDYN